LRRNLVEGWTCTNNGVSGTGMMDTNMAQSIFSTPVVQGQRDFINIGTNDFRSTYCFGCSVGMSTAAAQAQWGAGYAAELAWAAIPDGRCWMLKLSLRHDAGSHRKSEHRCAVRRSEYLGDVYGGNERRHSNARGLRYRIAITLRQLICVHGKGDCNGHCYLHCELFAIAYAGGLYTSFQCRLYAN
jgi:hypothetical protein